MSVEKKFSKYEIVANVLRKNPTATFGQVKEQMDAAEIGVATFNNYKSVFHKKALTKSTFYKKTVQDRPKETEDKGKVSLDDAFAFVRQAGGLAAAVANIQEQEKELDLRKDTLQRQKELVAKFKEVNGV